LIVKVFKETIEKVITEHASTRKSEFRQVIIAGLRRSSSGSCEAACETERIADVTMPLLRKVRSALRFEAAFISFPVGQAQGLYSIYNNRSRVA
jgi:hypothetical protein